MPLDLPDEPALVVINQEYTGQPGRPRTHFNPLFLEYALKLRNPTSLAKMLGCSSRTVRRRAVEYGFLDAGESPFQINIREDGTTTRVRVGAPRHTRITIITDAELDQNVIDILQSFPIGRTLMDGHLKGRGIRVPMARIRNSMMRIRGPTLLNYRQPVQRRVYNVAGVNSLWHHDGQHGLIAYKLVVHAFIDGKSRFITGARIHDNNRAATVLQLFNDAMQYGVPRRVRGDHGTENVEVARCIDAYHGDGAYIWGRSIHNTRIERLWYDFTQGVGLKWKMFFMDLEEYDGLDVDNPAHIQLLHWTFLESINDDFKKWVDGWNLHIISLRDEPNRSPADIFYLGMFEYGPRGIHHLIPNDTATTYDPRDEDIPDLSEFGIDWPAIEDPILLHHFQENNPDHSDNSDPATGIQFGSNQQPARLSEVVCEVGDNILPIELTVELQERLSSDPNIDLTSRDMAMRYLLWRKALHICQGLYSDYF